MQPQAPEENLDSSSIEVQPPESVKADIVAESAPILPQAPEVAVVPDPVSLAEATDLITSVPGISGATVETPAPAPDIITSVPGLSVAALVEIPTSEVAQIPVASEVVVAPEPNVATTESSVPVALVEGVLEGESLFTPPQQEAIRQAEVTAGMLQAAAEIPGVPGQSHAAVVSNTSNEVAPGFIDSLPELTPEAKPASPEASTT